MELISSIPIIGGLLGVVIPFLFVLSVIVVIHELGHYLVGRWCGIHAEKFSFGFGKAILHRTDKHGTRWQIGPFPFGGYVQFKGDADASSKPDPEALANMDAVELSNTFHGAALWKRVLTIAAGPGANFLLSIVVFAGLSLYQGVPSSEPVLGKILSIEGVENPLRTGDKVLSFDGRKVENISDIYKYAREMETPRSISVEVERDGKTLALVAPYPNPPVISEIYPFTAASRSDLLAGDYVRAIDGVEIVSYRQLLSAVETSEGRELILEVLRQGEIQTVGLTPVGTDVQNADGNYESRWRIGVSLALIYEPEVLTPGIFASLKFGGERVIYVITATFDAIKHMLIGDLSTSNLSGPIGIAQISGDSAERGLFSIITLIAFVSTAVGMFNLFPIPILDGGHLVFYAYEAVFGRPPAEKIMDRIMKVGLGMILLLMLFATYNDLVRLATQLMS